MSNPIQTYFRSFWASTSSLANFSFSSASHSASVSYLNWKDENWRRKLVLSKRTKTHRLFHFPPSTPEEIVVRCSSNEISEKSHTCRLIFNAVVISLSKFKIFGLFESWRASSRTRRSWSEIDSCKKRHVKNAQNPYQHKYSLSDVKFRGAPGNTFGQHIASMPLANIEVSIGNMPIPIHQFYLFSRVSFFRYFFWMHAFNIFAHCTSYSG